MKQGNKEEVSRNISQHSRINLTRKFNTRKRNCKGWFWKRNSKGWFWKQKRKMNCKSWFWKRMGFLMLPHPLTKFEIKRCYQNEPRFIGVSSRNNLPEKIKDRAYIINLDEYAEQVHIGLLFVREMKLFISIVLVFNMFLQKLKNLSEIKTKANIFRVQVNNSIMCRYFCIGLIGFMLVDKKLTGFTSLFYNY